MTEAKKQFFANFYKMQLAGGSISRAEYEQKLTAIGQNPPSVTPTVETLQATSNASQSIQQPVQPPQAASKTLQSKTQALDREKARLSNLLHTIPLHHSAKHITDKILELRKQRKQLYTDERAEIAAAAAAHVQTLHVTSQHATSPPPPDITHNASLKSQIRTAENLRINISRWEKKLKEDPDNQKLKNKIADGKAYYQQLRS